MNNTRKLPPLPNMKSHRKEVMELLTDEMYGRPGKYKFEYDRKREAGGFEKFTVRVTGEGGAHSFGFTLMLPKSGQGRVPAIVYLTNPHDHVPTAMLMTNGYAVAICHADEIEPDNAAGFPRGLAKTVGGTIGALAAWAEGLVIIGKILENHECIDAKRLTVAGCSRYGKAALGAGAKFEIFSTVASFDSGCGGAAINRGKKDEHISDMVRNFPHWLSPNMKKYIDNEDDIPFDQHFLLGLIAPRNLLVTSSTKDPYCDPYSEFLGLAYASKAYECYGRKGIGTWEQPEPEKLLIGDGAAYYLREGNHGVGVGDWLALMQFNKSQSIKFPEC